MTKILWFTGLSGSGKSTISNILERKFSELGKSFDVLDGDDVRNKLHRHLGFSREDIIENNRLIVQLVKKLIGKTDYVLVPIISPFKESRDNARKELGKGFIEIYLNCPYEVCKQRDVKGLYKKAESGELKNFIGLHHKYDVPEKPEIKLDVTKKTPEECADEVLSYLATNKESL